MSFKSDEEMRAAGGAETKTQMDRILKAPPAVVAPAAPTGDDTTEDEDKRKAAGTAGGGIPGRNERHEKRKERAQKRKESVAVVVTQDGRVDMLDQEDGRA